MKTHLFEHSGLEQYLFRWANHYIPKPIFRYLPTFYYRLNKYRFRLLRRPPLKRETSKAVKRREREGFFEKYCSGYGIDIGYGGDLVCPSFIGWDIEHGDAHYLTGQHDAKFETVYSSHLLEHLERPEIAIRNWWRILKPGGHLILYVPERDLAERKTKLPSDLSYDHKCYFLLERDDPPDTMGLIPFIRATLPHAEIVSAKICSDGYAPERTDPFAQGEYSIELVLRKPEFPPPS